MDHHQQPAKVPNIIIIISFFTTKCNTQKYIYLFIFALRIQPNYVLLHSVISSGKYPAKDMPKKWNEEGTIENSTRKNYHQIRPLTPFAMARGSSLIYINGNAFRTLANTFLFSFFV